MGEDAAELVGRTIAGRFVIERHLGGGAMGNVYRARHVTLDSPCAVKIMRPDIAKEPMYKERFYREAKAASRLEHANSVRVLDFGQEPDGTLYLAMELLSGHDLLEVIRKEWPIADERIVEIMSQTLSAASAAHALGIVHRDLKPENIMITTNTDDDGRTHDVVKVCDFGIAKTTDKRAFTTENDGKALTSSGMLIGTPEYMSPEQARGDPLDARSDLYSLGVVLYQLLTSRVPFTAENALGIVLKQVTDEPDPPEKRRPGVNPRLAAIALKALRKDASERYQTAKEMRTDLRAVFGYRAPMQSTESSGEIVVPRSDPEIHNAATIVAETKRSATSDGTEISIPVHSTRRALAGVLVGIAALALVGVGIFFGAAKKTDGAAASASAVSGNASTTTTATATAIATTTATAIAIPTTTARTNANTRLAPTSRAATSAARPDPSVAASAPPPPASIAAPSNYNPAGANVALGSVTTERVTKDAIRGLMGSLVPRLTQCYQDALRTAGAPIAGTAGIQMSIDASGGIVSVVDAPKLPELQRCAATVMRGAHVAPSAVESGGGTATQWLVLNP